MSVKALRPIFAFLVAVTYIAATVIAAESSLASGRAPETAPTATHSHDHHGHHHDHGSKTTEGDCLRCCLGGCLGAPCLSGPTIVLSEPAFVGAAVLYWALWPAIAGRSIAPDPGPPKPIA